MRAILPDDEENSDHEVKLVDFKYGGTKQREKRNGELFLAQRQNPELTTLNFYHRPRPCVLILKRSG